jgi:hypothetical protein
MTGFPCVAPSLVAAPDDPAVSQSEAIEKAIKVLLNSLSPSEQEHVLQNITDASCLIPAPRAGEVLGTVVRLLPRKSEWTVEDIKHQIEAEGVKAGAKEVYNALGYLTRKGHVRRIGYGRYVIDGVVMTTTEDLGGEPARYDDDNG